MSYSKKLSVPFLIAGIVFIIYFISSPGPTPYNYFVRLSNSFINGKLYISEKPSWLNELIPFNGKYYVAPPPMPAIVMMPIVSLFGQHVSETTFAIILASVNASLVYLLLRKLNFSNRCAFYVTTFFALGTNHWYLASVGSSWYLSHIVALFFLLLALIEGNGKKRLLLIGFLLGASFWSRSSVIFATLFFYILFWRQFWPVNFKHLLNFSKLNLGLLFFVILDFGYNYLRFGQFHPLTPYQLIQNVDPNTVINGVYMSLSYSSKHLDALIFRLPKLVDHFPYLIPSLYATAIWFTSPAIILIFRVRRNLLTLASWVALMAIFLVVVQWAGVGFTQFGYRFAQDFMPFILILMALSIGRNPILLAYFLLAWSIIINAGGVILINKFNLWVM